MAFFQPLDKALRQMRILDINPGEQNEPITCVHEISSIDSQPEYEALSYTWGSATPSSSILLNGKPYEVTDSLSIALHHLRKLNAPRKLWIDALCIDQSNNEEKYHQVGMMRDIYGRASQVLVWLGPADHDSDIGMDLVTRISKTPFTIHSSGRIESEEIKLDAQSVNALFRLMSRPYWTRVWIVQEIAMASSFPLVGCGSKWIPWSHWGRPLREIYRQLSALGTGPDPGGLRPFVDSRFLEDQYFDLDGVRKHTQRTSETGSRDLRNLSRNTDRTNFLSLLHRGREMNSTDARDHIYAFLGLISDDTGLLDSSRLRLKPDYTLSVRETFCQAARSVLEIEGSLQLLELKDHMPYAWLPSWVPNFAADLEHRYPSLGSDRWYDWRASGHMRSPGGNSFRISDSIESLFVQGWAVATIRSTVSLRRFKDNPGHIVRKVHKTATGSMAGKILHRTNRYTLDAIWRSLIGNRSEENSLPCEEAYADLYLQLLYGEGIEFVDEEIRPAVLDVMRFVKSMRRAICYSSTGPHRQFICTREGHFGLGTPDCQSGDIVCLLQGYKMPVILRAASDERRYTFLGSAYVHGIMNGEGIPNYHSGEAYQEFELI